MVLPRRGGGPSGSSWPGLTPHQGRCASSSATGLRPALTASLEGACCAMAGERPPPVGRTGRPSSPSISEASMNASVVQDPPVVDLADDQSDLVDGRPLSPGCPVADARRRGGWPAPAWCRSSRTRTGRACPDELGGFRAGRGAS
ncbi:hypothetical protein HBB16_05035 [Pseudonocardia sp. MCCB 268]|nr:hypothetical protein [Pseudonocardia cytotoxica]